MISNERKASLEAACAPWGDSDVRKVTCEEQLAAANLEIGSFDVYNLYDTCAGDTATPPKKRLLRDWNRLLDVNEIEVEGDAPPREPQLGAAVNDYPCGGDRAARQWLSTAEVAAALNVKAGTPGMRYQKGPMSFSGNLLPLYAELMKKYRMLIYSGDTDACVPTWGTVDWIDSLNLTVAKGWRPWKSAHLDGSNLQRAGYVKEYAVNNFTFATVQGAGHMVPTYKPHFALTLISKWLAGESL